jgi:hypothetical protein
MFCPKCGTQNEDTAAFCANCGTRLTEEAAAPVQQETVQQQVEPQVAAQQAGTQAAAQQQVEPQAAAQQAGVPVQQAAPAPRKPMDKKTRNIIIAAVAAVVVVILFVIVGNSLGNPERVVKKYFKAQMEGKWDKVYECVDLPKGDFVSKDAMKAAKQDSDVSEVTNFEISERDTDSDISKTYTITYYLAGSSKRTTTVDVVKSGKVLLFWNNYKVSSDDVVSRNVRINVSNDSSLLIDGTQVDDKYLDTDSESTTYKTYKIDYLMSGKHTFKATSDLYEDSEKDYTVSYDGDSFSLVTSTIKESVVEARKTAAISDVQTLIQAGVSRKDFSDIKGMFFAENQTKLSSVQSKFEKFRDNTHKSDGTGVTSATASNVTASDSSTGTTDGMPYVKVSVKLELSLVGKSSSNANEKSANKTVTDTITYIYKDGSWTIYDISLSSLYV